MELGSTEGGKNLIQVPLIAARITNRKKKDKNYFDKEDIGIYPMGISPSALSKGEKTPSLPRRQHATHSLPQ